MTTMTATATAMAMSDRTEEAWQYVYEALQNVRCLQLLLFHRALAPERDCVDFTAAVRHGSLHCAWNSPAGTPNSLVVALPACLLDLSLPARCWTRQDHVEVRLGLLSLDPALHLLQLSLEDESLDLTALRQPDSKPFSVDFDAQALESGDGVQFFCRTCSCQLTNAPFRRVIEVPSLDWREVSEHFYGNCCCASFGAQAELLAARFQQLLTSSQGTCLVASTTCTVHKGDAIISEGDKHVVETTSYVHVSHDRGSPKTEFCAGDHFDSKHHSKGLAATSESDHHQNGEDGRTTSVSGGKVSPEGVSESEAHQDEPCCSSSSCSNSNFASTEFSSAPKEASPESLGNGFMTGPQSEVLDWEPFFCPRCSSLVGARRGENSSRNNGLQFFKCNISTHELVLNNGNVFREHTLERLFTHELEKNTESNSSYRYVVRSFQTGAALLQLVLLNQNALVSSGTCPLRTTPSISERSPTQDRKAGNVSLKTVAKFMFCDCRMLELEELRLIDKWAQLQKADDIFMLDEVAETLVALLKSHQLAYPPSCQSFQQFRLSFLTK